MKNFTKAFWTFALLLFMTANAGWGQTTTNFNDGYLIVFKVTSGSALTSNGTAIVMEEYLNTGSSQTAPNYFVALPSSSVTLGVNDIVVSGSATAVGEISRSENGRYILIPGYNALINTTNPNFNTNSVVRILSGTGIMGSGIFGSNFLGTTSNTLRGATSDDATNYWMTGGSGTPGITTSTNGTTVTTVSSTSTNIRACFIFNGQLYFTTGAGSQGIYSVGTGKPIVTGTTSSRLFAPTNADTYGFSISPDSLTIYYVAAGSGGIYRSTYSGGAWTGGTLITTGFTSGTGIAVDWTGYTFNLTGANGAKIFATNPTTLISAPDNGTGTVTTTTLRTISGNNAFRGLAFSPTKSTVGLGSFNPPAGNITSNTINNKVFAFDYTADEGNVAMKKLKVTNTGTANLSTDFTAFRLVFDADGNGIISPTERSASTTVTGTVSGSDIIFPGLTFSYVNQLSTGNYIIEADVAAAPSSGNTLTLKIDKNNTINSNNYTTNLLNAGGSLVTMFGNAASLTGNTQTIGGGLTPAITLSSPNPAIPAGSITQNTANNVIYRFDLAVTTANATLSGLQITTAGTYAAADLTNLKAWYSVDNTFDPGTDALLSTRTTLLGAGTQVFPGWTNQLINSGSTGYIFITTDIPCSASSGNTIYVSAVTTSDLTFISGNLSGSAFAGGTQTFQSATPVNVTIPSGTWGDTQITLNWTNPSGCYNEIMIAASTGTITTAPTGDGSAYTDSLHYGSGTPFGAGYVVYKGSATGQIVTGLTNGTPYYFKFFTRNGTNWSAGTEIIVTYIAPPNAPVLLIPANNAVNQLYTNLTFLWAKAIETIAQAPNKGETGKNSPLTISNYLFELSTDAGFATFVSRDSLVADTTKMIATLTSNINYYWRVKAKNQTGWGEYSSIFTFRTALDPALLSQANFNSVIIPQIMSCGGTTRLPVVIRATLINLVPNKLYRYYSNGAVFTDLGGTNPGAGNPIFINPDSANYRYTTSTSLTTDGGYDVFRADGSGTYTGWFSIVNTANARFTAGKYIIPAVVIGDSLGALVSKNALNDSIRVVNFSGNNADTCATGIFGISVAFPKNIVSVYDNISGTGKPLSQTYLEDEGVTVASIAPFYSTNVNAQNGRWGTVIPNVNANGVRRIEQRDKITGSLMTFNTDADGLWQSGANTVNPSGGLTPVALQLIDAPLLNYPVLVSPANNATNQELSLTLDWNVATYVSSYRVQLATDSAFTTILKDSTLVPDSLFISGLANNQSYWWRVAGITTTGTAPFGSAYKFTTITSILSLDLKVYLEGFWNGAAQASDTVRIYLAAATSPYTLIDSQKVVLGTAGTTNPTFTGILSGNYYIVVKHRNHLETWSKLPQTFVAGTPLSYDFTTAATQAFGDNMKQVGSVWVLYGGDANQDGEVSAFDIPIFIFQFGTQGYLSCDFNGDGDVNATDVPIFRNNFGLTRAVPTLFDNPNKGKKNTEENTIKKNNTDVKNNKETKKNK